MKLFFALPLLGLMTVSCPAQVHTTPAPSFEVADIHVSPHRAVAFANGGVLRDDRYVWHQATMLDLISAAYSIDSRSIVGGPSWLETERYEIVAKAVPGTPSSQLMFMLRKLLIERFRLVIREEKRPMPAYVLRVSHRFGKPKMTQSSGLDQGGCAPSNSSQSNAVTIDLVCRNVTMAVFAETLHREAGGYLSNPVFDETGLKGAWDFELKWTDKDHLASEGVNGISLFDAVDDQLGVRLNLGTAPGPVVVVDNIDEAPTPNAKEIAKQLPQPPPPTFDVAVIKPSKPDENTVADIEGGRVDVRGITMRNLIAFAWNVNPNDHEAIANAPKWIDTDKFDLLAKASPEIVTTAPNRHATSIDLEELREMQQNLLIDRFQIKAHMENRPVWAYTLFAVKPKLHVANPSIRAGCKEGPGPDGKDPRIASPELDRLISCQNMTMAQLCDELQRIGPSSIYGSVKDDTGLSGSYDFTLSFSSSSLNAPLPSDSDAADRGVPHPSGALTIFQAVSKELGLKLERQKRSAPVLVIDHMEEKPTEN